MEMALRIKIILALCSVTVALAAPDEYAVRHRHPRKGGDGTLRFDDSGVSFTESGKKAKHSRQWKYEEIQELTLAPNWMRIVTYEDIRWQIGRDREYVFDHVPEGFADRVYPVLSRRLDQRFLAAIADASVEALWEVPVKALNALGGSEGTLIVGRDRLVYKSSERDQSRTWRVEYIDNISSSGPFEMTLVSLNREVRFQLKRAISERAYTELWRRIHAAKGLVILKTVSRSSSRKPSRVTDGSEHTTG